MQDARRTAAQAQRHALGWGFGAQAILTARGWEQSERFNEECALLTAHSQVVVLAKVIPITPPKPLVQRANGNLSQAARIAGLT